MKIKYILLISVMAALFLFILGCGSKYKEGYIIDKGKKQVIWRTVDAGYGVREKIVQGADVKTFEIMDFKYDPYFKRDSFAKDKQYVYWQGCIIKNADPKTFRYEQNVYKDNKQRFICDSSFGFISKKEYKINSSKKSKETVQIKNVYIQKLGDEIGVFLKNVKRIEIGDNYGLIIKLLGKPTIDRKESSYNSSNRVLYYFLRKEDKNSIHAKKDYYFRLTLDKDNILTDIFEKPPTAPRFLKSN